MGILEHLGKRDYFPEPRFWTVKSGFAPSGALSVNAAAVLLLVSVKSCEAVL